MRRHLPATRSMNPPWRWALAGGVTGLMLALLAGAPARWMTPVVAWATNDRIRLQDERGTLWTGSARLSLSGGPGTTDRRSLPGRIDWRWGLLWPGLSLQLSAACCTAQPLQWQVRVADGGLRLQLLDQQSDWPMGLLGGLGAPWNTLEADGRLHWQSQGLGLQWRQGQLLWQGQAELQVLQFESRLSTLRPMGSYRLALKANATGMTHPELRLETLQGPLRLQGQGQWSGQRLRFRGEAMADPDFEAALSNLLNIIGRRDGARSLLSLG